MAEGFRTALLKISGEALAGDQGYGIDPEAARGIASEIAEPVRQGRQVGVVIGGGNILRGANAASVGVPELVADQMGMMATVINALAPPFSPTCHGSQSERDVLVSRGQFRGSVSSRDRPGTP